MTQPDQLQGELRELLHRRAADVTGALDGPLLRAMAMRNNAAAEPNGRRAVAMAHVVLASAAVLAVALAVTFLLGRSPETRQPPAGRTTPTAPYVATTTPGPAQPTTVRPTPTVRLVPTGGRTKPPTSKPSTSKPPATKPSTVRPTTPLNATAGTPARV